MQAAAGARNAEQGREERLTRAVTAMAQRRRRLLLLLLSPILPPGMGIMPLHKAPLSSPQPHEKCLDVCHLQGGKRFAFIARQCGHDTRCFTSQSAAPCTVNVSGHQRRLHHRAHARLRQGCMWGVARLRMCTPEQSCSAALRRVAICRSVPTSASTHTVLPSATAQNSQRRGGSGVAQSQHPMS
jgi:hypothetical protein